MKGKLKFGLKIMLTVAVSLFTGVCFVGLQPSKVGKELPAHAVATIDGKEYSALLGGDVILLVEKVSVDENGDYDTEIEGRTPFYQRLKDERGDDVVKEIYFNDINSEDKAKQVVEDGQFVMLNNQKVGNQYLNKNSDSDVVIISLGQYVLNDNTISTAPATWNEHDSDAEKEQKKDIACQRLQCLFS